MMPSFLTGIYLSRKRPYSTYKPGQIALERNYYDKETNFVPNGTLSLGNYKRYNTIYQERLANTVKPKDYVAGKRGINQQMDYEFMHAQELPKTLYKTTKHWNSNYKEANLKCFEKAADKAQKPKWSEIKPAHTSDRMFKETEYHKAFGCFGSNPRNKLPASTTQLKNEENAHVIGTTKLTSHIPGYTGFLPMSSSNANAINQSKGLGLRETFLKQNIVEN